MLLFLLRYHIWCVMNKSNSSLLWDLWTTVKRLDWLRYDGDEWTCQHSTGSLSFFNPEDGTFYGNSSVMLGAHYDALRPVLPKTDQDKLTEVYRNQRDFATGVAARANNKIDLLRKALRHVVTLVENEAPLTVAMSAAMNALEQTDDDDPLHKPTSAQSS